MQHKSTGPAANTADNLLRAKLSARPERGKVLLQRTRGSGLPKGWSRSSEHYYHRPPTCCGGFHNRTTDYRESGYSHVFDGFSEPLDMNLVLRKVAARSARTRRARRGSLLILVLLVVVPVILTG